MTKQKEIHIMELSICIMLISIVFILYLGSSEDILININYAFKITSLIGSTGIVYSIFKLKDYTFKNNKKLLSIITILLIVYVLIGDKIIARLVHYQNPINACNYLNKCTNSTIFSYEKDKYHIIFNSYDAPFYYLKNNEYWTANTKNCKIEYMYVDADILVKIYALEDKYFVIIEDKNDIILDIKDTTEAKFENLVYFENPKIKFKDYYGKIIETVNDYKIIKNGEEISLRKI